MKNTFSINTDMNETIKGCVTVPYYYFSDFETSTECDCLRYMYLSGGCGCIDTAHVWDCLR